MEKFLEALPNYTILADCNEGYYQNGLGILRTFCEVESSAEHVDTFRISASSFWKGMNRMPDFDFIGFLKENSKSDLPENVETELKGFLTKMDTITLIGNDILMINSEDLLNEIKNSSTMEEFITDIKGNLVFFSKTNLHDLSEIFEYEFGHPIKIRRSDIRDYTISDGSRDYWVKAASKLDALKALYGKHPLFNEHYLRTSMRKTKEITEEDVANYVEKHLTSNSEDLVRFEVKEMIYNPYL